MLKPLRLLGESLRQFAIGLGPALLLAFVCLAIQLAAGPVAYIVGHAIFPPPPEPDIDSPTFIQDILERDYGWRYQTRQLLEYTVGLSIRFFFHALVGLIVTSWLIYRPHGLHPVTVFRALFGRAVRGACMLTGGAALVFAAAYFVDNVHPATSHLRFDFKAAALVAVWFGGTALLLPARLMGHQPAAARGFVRTTLTAAVALVPWFYASEVLGAPLRHCRDCGGLFDGGLIYLGVLGMYLLGLTVSSAAVSAAACMTRRPEAHTPRNTVGVGRVARPA